MMVARGLALLVVGFFLMSAVASAAAEAPRRLASDPQEGAELDAPPERVSITFSEPLLEGSELQVLDECERRVDDDSPQITANEMSVGIVEESSGTYGVSYTAVGPTGTGTGGFTFTVHGGEACDPASGDHHGADGGGGSGGSSGSGGHSGGHGGGGSGGGSGGSEPNHGEGGGHGDESSTGSVAGGHSSGDHANDADASHERIDDGNNHSARSRTKDEQHHRAGREARVTAGDPPAASSYVAAAAPAGRAETGARSWTTLAALAIAGLFGVAGGWLLRGARLRRASASERH